MTLLTCTANHSEYTMRGGLCKVHNLAEAGPIPGATIIKSDRKG